MTFYFKTTKCVSCGKDFIRRRISPMSAYTGENGETCTSNRCPECYRTMERERIRARRAKIKAATE